MTDRFAQSYTITLNRYQLDNLRWLIRLTGYPHGKDAHKVEPFQWADSGDWLGELYWKLRDVAPDVENDEPNRTPSEMKRLVTLWVVDQCD